MLHSKDFFIISKKKIYIVLKIHLRILEKLIYKLYHLFDYVNKINDILRTYYQIWELGSSQQLLWVC